MVSKNSKHSKNLIPERFRVSRSILLVDRIMTGVVIGGGLMVIASVLGIFFFIFAEALPLFRGAEVSQTGQSSLQTPDILPLDGLPDLSKGWLNTGFDDRSIYLFHTETGRFHSYTPQLDDGERIQAVDYDLYASCMAYATNRQRVGIVNKGEDDESYQFPAGEDCRVLDMSLAVTDNGHAVFVLAGQGGEQKSFLMRSGDSLSLADEECPPEWLDVQSLHPAKFTTGILSREGDALVLSTADNSLVYCTYDEDMEEWELRQVMQSPLGSAAIASVSWVYGSGSIAVGGEDGSLNVLSIYPQKDGRGRNVHWFGKTKSWEPFNGHVKGIMPSAVNRSFIAFSDNELRLCYSTTGDTRWSEQDLGFMPVQVSADDSFKNMAVLDADGHCRHYDISDGHPEAGMKAFFGKIQYEGYDRSAWQWQSVGGTDSYEPKLSLVPLLFGTLKGTVYALLFATPVAILAAIYTSQFMSPGMRSLVKPTMEIMASLPSVVLGFFGALYIAPLMEDKVPAITAMLIILPLATIGLASFWIRRPIAFRSKFPKGIEYLVMIPVLVLAVWACWNFVGGWIEPALVKTLLPLTGFSGDSSSIHTFADLWRNGFGLPYEQRNSLVVGFIMGFAVIPVIFTISEDALSNVPSSLVYASEALGANRWQVVRTIVLPVAAAGIFSALMIGFGRAIGETMIVLMATGNTPVMDWNIFNGMRTLSANIATELPEAAEHSTHYRVLFLCGLILFAMTFALNTLAEILRNRLRERYKII